MGYSRGWNTCAIVNGFIRKRAGGAREWQPGAREAIEGSRVGTMNVDTSIVHSNCPLLNSEFVTSSRQTVGIRRVLLFLTPADW